MPTTLREHNRRTWSYRIAASLIGLVLSLVVAEITLRVFDLAPVGGLATVTQRDFDRLPGLFMPGQRLVDRVVPALPYQISIDSLGYRGVGEFPRSKPPGETRIVLLGDSFTFGYLVDDAKTLPAQLEETLRARCEGPVQIINAGIGGTSIETAAPMAERALPLNVDIAVLTFTENDVTDLTSPMWDQLTANRAAKSRFPMSVVYPVARELALWNLLLKARDVWRNRRTQAATSTSPRQNSGAQDSAVIALRAQYQRRLLELRDRLARADVPLVFVIYPSHLTVYRLNSGDQVRWAEQVAHEAGIRTVNYLEALQRDGRSMEQLYLLPIDGHPSAAGYSLVAPVLGDTLMAISPLARHCAPPRTTVPPPSPSAGL